MVRIYRSTRWFAIALLFGYVAIRSSIAPNWWSEIILFNSIPIAIILSIYSSKVAENLHSRRFVAASLGSWCIGSLISSTDSFFGTGLSTFSDFLYCAFYPLILVGLWRAFSAAKENNSLTLIDLLMISSGVSALAISILIRTIESALGGNPYEISLAIFYPTSDLVLLLSILFMAMTHKANQRNLYFTSGILIFVIADFYFLWQSLNDGYDFGSLTDTFWLVGFILIEQGFWRSSQDKGGVSISASITSIALISSGIVLLIYLLQPGYFPSYVIYPALVTLLLGSIKVSVSLRALRQINEEQRLALTDELTGVANRRSFLTQLAPFLASPGSLLILDLDGFKPINDGLGHDIGDEVLRQVAKRFQRAIPEGALLARLGGDEFGALIPGDDGAEIARALRGTLSYPIEIAGREISLGVSIGEAFNQPGECLGEQLMRRADEAMYRAKRSRQGVLRWSDSIMR